MYLNVCVFVPGILHGAGLWQLPKQLYLPTEEKSSEAPNSHLKYVWYGSGLGWDSCSQPLLFLDPLQDLLLLLSAFPPHFCVLFKEKACSINF